MDWKTIMCGHKYVELCRNMSAFLVAGIAVLSILCGGCTSRLSESKAASSTSSTSVLSKTDESGALGTGTSAAETSSRKEKGTEKSNLTVSTEILVAPSVPKWDDIQPDIPGDTHTTVSKKGDSTSATTNIISNPSMPNSTTTEENWIPGVW